MAEQSDVPPGLNLGGAISEKIADSIRNMDVLSVLQKMVATTPEDEESEEIRDKLKGVMDKFYAMSESEQELFTQQIREGLANKISMRMNDGNFAGLSGLDDAIRNEIVYKLVLFGAGVLFLVILLVFFGYKLFKSIKEKERKKEEKKKAKQMKKKK